MVEKVKVITAAGKEISLAEWQKMYGLEVGSDQVGKYFSLRDPKLRQDINDYGQLIVNELLMRVMDEAREILGPLDVNSFNRNEAKQKCLQDNPNLKAATWSPHVVFMACDINVPVKTLGHVRKYADAVKKAAQKLGIKVRIGWEDYLKGKNPMYFVHFDVCPMYYAPGKPFNSQKHPVQWESSITW